MKTLLYWLAALGVGAYVLSPVDLVPDVFFGIGWLDDAALIAIAFRMYYTLKRAKAMKNKTTKQDDGAIEIDFKDIKEDEKP